MMKTSNQHKCSYKAAFALCVMVWVCIPILLPALMVEYDLDRLVNESTDIVTGKVTQKESKWNEDKTIIFTEVTVKVTEAIKGQDKESLIVQYPGGQITGSDGKGIGMGRSDQPRFQVGENIMLFLHKDETKQAFKVTGQFQGKFDLAKDPETKEVFVKSPSKVLAHPDTLKVREVGEYKVPLKDLKLRIKDIIAAKEKNIKESTEKK